MNRHNDQDPPPPATTRPAAASPAAPPPATALTVRAIRKALPATVLVILSAVFAALAIWVIAVPVAGVGLTAGGLAIGPAAVLLVSLGSGCVAGLSFLAMTRFRSGPAVWTVLGCLVLLLSLGGPVLSGAIGASLLVLEIMHLVVGATMLVGLRLLAVRNAAENVARTVPRHAARSTAPSPGEDAGSTPQSDPPARRPE